MKKVWKAHHFVCFGRWKMNIQNNNVVSCQHIYSYGQYRVRNFADLGPNFIIMHKKILLLGAGRFALCKKILTIFQKHSSQEQLYFALEKKLVCFVFVLWFCLYFVLFLGQRAYCFVAPKTLKKKQNIPLSCVHQLLVPRVFESRWTKVSFIYQTACMVFACNLSESYENSSSSLNLFFVSICAYASLDWLECS